MMGYSRFHWSLSSWTAKEENIKEETGNAKNVKKEDTHLIRISSVSHVIL